jgi:hypothetical protein
MKVFARFCASTLVVMVIASTRASADPVVVIAPTSLGNGLYEYDLTVENMGGTQPIQGLILFNATSTFGLDFSSTVTTPAGWGYIPPFAPPPGDILTYYSSSPSTDIPINGTLGGLSFDSSYLDLTSSDFVLNSVGSYTSTEQVIVAQLVPEPSSFVLLASSLLIGLGYACRHSQRR